MIAIIFLQINSRRKDVQKVVIISKQSTLTIGLIKSDDKGQFTFKKKYISILIVKIFFLQSNLHWICVQKVLIISKHYHDQDNEGLLTLLTFYNWNKNETIFYISRKTVNKAKSGWKLAT